MWIPRCADELLARLGAGDLHESALLDGKRELTGGPEVVVDVCAMTVNGGVLLVGVGEDEAGTRLVTPMPIELAGQRERVEQKVSTGISEPPVIEVRALPLREERQRGFLAIVVPPSPRAPHQVVVKGKYEGRFYTRDGSTNRILDQAGVEALYAKRARWERDFEADVRAHAHATVAPDANNAVELTFYADPVTGSSRTLTAGPAGDPTQMLASAVRQAIRASPADHDFLGFSSLLAAWRRSSADSWTARLVDADGSARTAATVDRGGAVALAARVGARDEYDPQVTVINELAVAATTTRACAPAGQVLGHLGYRGLVDVGVLVRPLLNVYSRARAPYGQRPTEPYGAHDYLRHTRQLAHVLLERPADVTHGLVGELIATTAGWHYDAFVEPWRR